jgi:hypothetical protein
MTEVGYVTAKNLFHHVDLPPHPKLSAATIAEAGKQIGEIRESLKTILDCAINGARDLMEGDCWSRNIDMFESLSMEQARALAIVPIGTNHPKLGPRIFHARAAFVAFREYVRWEVVGKVSPDTTQADLEEILSLVSEYAAQARDSMLRIEKNLDTVNTDYLLCDSACRIILSN